MTEEKKPEGPKCDCVADHELPKLVYTGGYKLGFVFAYLAFNIGFLFVPIGVHQGSGSMAWFASGVFGFIALSIAVAFATAWCCDDTYRKVNRRGVDVWAFYDEDDHLHQHLFKPELRPDGWYVVFRSNDRVTYKRVKGYVLKLAVGGKNRQSAVFTESGLPFAERDIWCRGLKDILLISDDLRAGVVFSSPGTLLDWLNAGLPYGKDMLQRTISQYSHMTNDGTILTWLQRGLNLIDMAKKKLAPRGKLPKTTKVVRNFLEDALAVELPTSATNLEQIKERAEAQLVGDMGRYLHLNAKGEPFFPPDPLGPPIEG